MEEWKVEGSKDDSGVVKFEEKEVELVVLGLIGRRSFF